MVRSILCDNASNRSRAYVSLRARQQLRGSRTTHLQGLTVLFVDIADSTAVVNQTLKRRLPGAELHASGDDAALAYAAM
jgi:hypothetical protein